MSMQMNFSGAIISKMPAASKQRIQRCILGVLLCCAWSSLQGQGHSSDSLFADYKGVLTQEQEQILINYTLQPTAADIRVVALQYYLARKDTVILNVFPGKSVRATKREIVERGENDFSWIGDYLGYEGSVVLTMKDGHMVGTVRFDKEIYTIKPIGDGIHAIVHVDPSQLPPDCDTEYTNTIGGIGLPTGGFADNSTGLVDDRSKEINIANQVIFGKTILAGKDTIYVLVAYTTAVDSIYGQFVDLYISNWVDETNDTYDNSDIDVELILSETMKVNYTETSYYQDRERLVNPADGYRLMPLAEVETYIKANRHLPDMPPAAEVEENGVALGDMQARILQKVEELTLYVIDLQKENEALKERLESLER